MRLAMCVGRALQDVLEVGMRVVTAQACRLHQAHHDGGALTSQFATGEQPGAASHGPRTDSIFQVVVVHRHIAVDEIARQRSPGIQAVAQGLGCSPAVGDPGTLELQPHTQLLPQRPGHRLTHA